MLTITYEYVFTYGVPVALDSSIRILQLYEFVAHEGPGREVAWVELKRPLEVSYSFLVLTAERVIVPDDAAGLCAILVDLRQTNRIYQCFARYKNTNLCCLVCEIGQLHPLLLNVEEVGVRVQIVQPVRVDVGQALKVVHSLIHLPQVVKRDGYLQCEGASQRPLHGIVVQYY